VSNKHESGIRDASQQFPEIYESITGTDVVEVETAIFCRHVGARPVKQLGS